MSWTVPPTFVRSFHDEMAIRKTTYRRLGNTDMVVSKLALGGGPFGRIFGKLDDDPALIVNEALRLGVNYVDTAYWYGQGLSEEALGKAFRNIPRSAFYVGTKVGRYEQDYGRMFDFRAERVFKSVDDSLRRMGLSYVDIIQIHDLEFASSEDIILNETLPALDTVRYAGKARYIGITGYPLDKLKRILEQSTVKIDVVLTYSRGTMMDQTLSEYIPYFQKVLGSNVGSLFFNYATRGQNASGITLKKFDEVMRRLHGNNSIVYLDLFLKSDELPFSELVSVFHVCRAAAGVPFHFIEAGSSADQRFLTSLCQKWEGEESVGGGAVREWISNEVPRLFDGLQRFVCGGLLGEGGAEEEGAGSSILSPFQYWILLLSLPPTFLPNPTSSQSPQANNCVSTNLHILYDSATDGLSPSRLENKVFGYRGPTLLLLQMSDGSDYCVGLDEEWRLGTKQWGKSDCFVWKILPKIERLEEGSGLIYYNMKTRGFPLGLIIGRNPKSPTLKIDDEFSNLHAIEILGCDSGKAVRDQQQQKEWEKRQVEKHKKVPLPGKWDENPDRMLLEMAGVRHFYSEQQH